MNSRKTQIWDKLDKIPIIEKNPTIHQNGQIRQFHLQTTIRFFHHFFNSRSFA